MITISQSIIKRLFKYDAYTDQWNYREFCPYKVKTLYIDGTIQCCSDSMLKGKYFETLFLGSGRDGEMTLDLPRKKLTKKQEQENIIAEFEGKPILNKGGETIDQERIREQVLRGEQKARELKIDIIKNGNTQVKILKKFSNNIMLSCNIDIFPTSVTIGNSKPSLAIIDIKLTSDLNAKAGYTEFCWGEFEKMDPIQGYMYHYMVRDINPVLNPHLKDLITENISMLILENKISFYFWVFNYRPGKNDVLRNEFYSILWDDLRKDKLEELIKKTASTIEYYDTQGWLAHGSYEVCKNCPIKNCNKKITIQEK